MIDNQEHQKREEELAIEREILLERKFTPEEALMRQVGASMKGESPVVRMRQAEMHIGSWLRTHLTDSGGALEIVLHRGVKGSELLLHNFEEPLVVLACYCQQVLDSEYLLKEVVRNADVEWGRLMDERPYFEREGSPRHPADPYTIESVRTALSGLIEQLSLK